MGSGDSKRGILRLLGPHMNPSSHVRVMGCGEQWSGALLNSRSTFVHSAPLYSLGRGNEDGAARLGGRTIGHPNSILISTTLNSTTNPPGDRCLCLRVFRLNFKGY